MKISRLGEAPDYRFSLANERTFLAWIRTALGFLAAGVGLDQLAPDFATPLIREILALLLCLFAGGMAIYGYLRWLNNEKAMRLKQDLPYTRTLLVISILLLAVVAAVMLLLSYVQLTTLAADTVALKSELTVLQAENVSLTAQHEQMFDMATVKEVAAAAGMAKPTSSQITYLDLDSEDSAVVYRTETPSVFSRILSSLHHGVYAVVEYFD